MLKRLKRPSLVPHGINRKDLSS